jgi:hypothetical protein
MPESDTLDPAALNAAATANAAATEAVARSAAASPAASSETKPSASPASSADAAARTDRLAERLFDLKTSLSWRPSIHDRKLQLRVLTAGLLAFVIYACFHFGLYLNTRLALRSEQQRVDDLFENCLDHNGNSQHVIFSGMVRQDAAAQPGPTAGISETISPLGKSYTFAPWSDISRIADPTVFVGRLGDGAAERLVVITVDGNPAGGRADAGNLAIRVSTYASDLPLRRRWEGEAQLNIYLRDGATFRVFEASRESDGNGAAIEIDSDKQRALIRARLSPDGVISLLDDKRAITHDTTVYELDLTGGA